MLFSTGSSPYYVNWSLNLLFSACSCLNSKSFGSYDTELKLKFSSWPEFTWFSCVACDTWELGPLRCLQGSIRQIPWTIVLEHCTWMASRIVMLEWKVWQCCTKQTWNLAPSYCVGIHSIQSLRQLYTKCWELLVCKWEVALNPQLSFTALAIHLSIYKVYEYVQTSVTIYVQRKKLVNSVGNVKILSLQK